MALPTCVIFLSAFSKEFPADFNLSLAVFAFSINGFSSGIDLSNWLVNGWWETLSTICVTVENNLLPLLYVFFNPDYDIKVSAKPEPLV